MEGYVSLEIVTTINLCDATQEPSDTDLDRLMDCVALEEIKRSEQAARSLNATIDHEIANVRKRVQ
jgi:hypothetical protein